MRRWHIRSYQALNALLVPMYQSDNRLLPWIRDRLLAPLATWPVIRGVKLTPENSAALPWPLLCPLLRFATGCGVQGT